MNETRSTDSVTPEELREFQSLALDMAVIAGDKAAQAFRNSSARRKKDGSLVTLADEANDRLIMARIKAAYPDHAVLSEEQTTVYDPDDAFTWVVDPIDGTTNFARGLLIWGVSIALLHHGAPIVGVVHFPLLQETYAAMAGLGATRNGEAIQSATDIQVSDEQLIMQCTRTVELYRVRTSLKTRTLGSAAYHLCKVADGTALAGIETTPKLWDLAAVAVILSEAGALLRKTDGDPIFPIPPVCRDYGEQSITSMVAANQDIYAELVGALFPVI